MHSVRIIPADESLFNSTEPDSQSENDGQPEFELYFARLIEPFKVDELESFTRLHGWHDVFINRSIGSFVSESNNLVAQTMHR